MNSSTSFQIAVPIPRLHLFHTICTALILLILLFPSSAASATLSSRYATIVYSDPKLLKKFNDKLYVGRSLRRAVKKRNPVTTADEIKAKADAIIEKAEIVLDMFPNKLHITIVLLPKARDVARTYCQKYGKKVKHIAYYSLSEDTIYISVSNSNLEVFSHEVGHAVVDHFFKVRPPYNIHELMAQFTSAHIND